MDAYRVVLTNGTTIPIDAEEVGITEGGRVLVFYSHNRLVAKFNMDNIAGWIESEHIPL